MSVKQPSDAAPGDPFARFFEQFNAADYYEAHETLEARWHEARRDSSPSADFYKALIQLAGAFCHLKLHFAQPHHRAHQRRLRPALKLFRSARELLEPYQPLREGLNLAVVEHLILRHIYLLEAFNCRRNPWFPEAAPQLFLEPEA